MAEMDLSASNSRPRPPWRRLGVLAVLVLAAHLAVLQGAPSRVSPVPTPRLQFATRSVVALAPAAPAVPAAPDAPAPVAVAAPLPAPAAPPKPVTLRRAPAQSAAPAGWRSPAPASSRSPAPPPPGAAPVRALALPAPARLHYEVILTKGGITLAGRALLEWRHDGQEYEARLAASGPGGERVQRSTGRITADGLVPGYFSDKGRGEQATHFDRASGRLVFSNNRPEGALAEGMQDRLSVIVQLVALVGGEPAKYRAGTSIAIPTATTHDAGTWIFSVEAEEELQLPGGAVRALKLQRMPGHAYDQKLELWLAPGLDYAPVRLRLTNPNGDTADQRWSATDKG